MKEIVQAFCKDSKCLYDVYTKEKTDSLLEEVNDSIEEARNNINDRYTKTEIDELLSNRQPTILFGTTTPASSLGNDGDVYLQYE